MVKIEDIDSTIRRLIAVDESIVSNYDSKTLCNNYDEGVNNIRKLLKEKKELTELLTSSLNEFFEINHQNLIFKKFKINSFRLSLNPINFCFKFSLPRSVDKSSRQFFCYQAMMDKLSRDYNTITKEGNDYYLLDLTLNLKLNDLINDKKYEM